MWSNRTVYRAPNVSAPPVEYFLFTPRRIRELRPLFCWLHGYGQRIQPKSPFTDVADRQQPWFLLLPQAPFGSNWAPGVGRRQGSFRTPVYWAIKTGAVHWTHTLLVGLLDALVREQYVDGNRIVLGGASMGGYGTWDTIVRYPHIFAVAVPMASGGDPTRAHSLGSIAIWAFHAANDTVVPVAGSQRMTQAVASARSVTLELHRLDNGTTAELRSSDGRLRYTELVDEACLRVLAKAWRKEHLAVHVGTMRAGLGGRRVFNWVQRHLSLTTPAAVRGAARRGRMANLTRGRRVSGVLGIRPRPAAPP